VKCLVDQQLPRSLASFVQARGHEALHVKDIFLQNAEDRTIWQEASRRAAIIISKDEDFSLISSAGGGAQVVWVRTGNCSNAHLLSRFESARDQLIVQLESGVALVELR
jgi:predicted nuclease of predicted toxin-antitoxin system